MILLGILSVKCTASVQLCLPLLTHTPSNGCTVLMSLCSCIYIMHVLFYYLFFIQFLISLPLAAAAYIDINGTDDTVRVTLMANGTSTIWSATQTNYNFSIHRLPTDHTRDPTARCAVFASNAYLVEALGPMGGSVNLPLSSLLMCSIVATDSSSGLIRGCGTIMGNMTDETTFARAVFYRPIGGTLYLLNYGGTYVYICVCMCIICVLKSIYCLHFGVATDLTVYTTTITVCILAPCFVVVIT